jgi:hypothetical protein
MDIKAAEEHIIETTENDKIIDRFDAKPPCPCSTCAKSRSWERNQIINSLLMHKTEYLIYRGSSFDNEGNLLWAKDDAASYAEGIDKVIEFIENREPKKAAKK